MEGSVSLQAQVSLNATVQNPARLVGIELDDGWMRQLLS